MDKSRIITNTGTLKMLERAGFIKEPVWGFYPFVDTTSKVLLERFSHKGKVYRTRYIDGSFYPVLEETTA